MDLCSNLPLGLRVMGSSLRRKEENQWEDILYRLENGLDRKIEGVLRVGYDNLHKNDQLLFLLIAFFFNHQDDDHVKEILGDSNLDVRLGLRTFTYKSLIQISTQGNIVMHKLLQQVGREAVQIQEPRKRQILIDTDEICDVLENGFGSTSVMGISFDISTIPNDVYVSTGAFKKMRNLRFLSIYKTRHDTNVRLHVPEDMDFPPRLRLLHWEVYPGNCLRPENLVELNLKYNQLEKLWEGTQPLTNLKKRLLSESANLKELPDLSNATNLKRLNLNGCENLVEIPSSIGNLHKLEWLAMAFCINLQVIPTHFNLASLLEIFMVGCSQLRKIPNISTNITSLLIADTMLEEVPESSVRLWSRLQSLNIYGSVSTFPFFEEWFQERKGADIEKTPDFIKDLHRLEELYIGGCPKLASLPELPGSLRKLTVDICESVETVSFPFDSQIEHLHFPNCFKLDGEAQREIIKQSGRVHACLPGRKISAKFDHQAIGNSLTIRSSFYRFRVCVVVSPKQRMLEVDFQLLCRIRLNGSPIDENIFKDLPYIRAKHLFMFPYELLDEDGWLEHDNEISFEFSTRSQDIDVIECGVQMLTYETHGSIRNYGSYTQKSIHGEKDKVFSQALFPRTLFFFSENYRQRSLAAGDR